MYALFSIYREKVCFSLSQLSKIIYASIHTYRIKYAFQFFCVEKIYALFTTCPRKYAFLLPTYHIYSMLFPTSQMSMLSSLLRVEKECMFSLPCVLEKYAFLFATFRK
jgi:hypothetical protein